MHRPNWAYPDARTEEGGSRHSRSKHDSESDRSRARSPKHDEVAGGRLRGSGGSSSNSSRRRSETPPRDRRERRSSYKSPPRSGFESETCKEFLKGRCTRGSRCRYSHAAPVTGGAPDMATLMQLQSQLLAQMLFPAVVAPAAGPPCRHFAIGKCSRVPCKFSHGNGFPPNMMAGLQQMAQLQQAQAHAQAKTHSQTGPPCRDYAVGHCARGSSCRFGHQMGIRSNDLVSSSRSRGPRPCSDFARGSCTRDGCKFLHATKAPSDTVCRDFAAGDCSRGSSCKFAHDTDALEPAPLEVCRDFASGNCVRDQCRFSHESTRTQGSYRKEDHDSSHSPKYDSDTLTASKRGRQERDEDEGRKKLRITAEEIDPRTERDLSEARSEPEEPAQEREWSDSSNHGRVG